SRLLRNVLPLRSILEAQVEVVVAVAARLGYPQDVGATHASLRAPKLNGANEQPDADHASNHEEGRPGVSTTLVSGNIGVARSPSPHQSTDYQGNPHAPGVDGIRPIATGECQYTREQCGKAAEDHQDAEASAGQPPAPSVRGGTGHVGGRWRHIQTVPTLGAKGVHHQRKFGLAVRATPLSHRRL